MPAGAAGDARAGRGGAGRAAPSAAGLRQLPVEVLAAVTATLDWGDRARLARADPALWAALRAGDPTWRQGVDAALQRRIRAAAGPEALTAVLAEYAPHAATATLPALNLPRLFGSWLWPPPSPQEDADLLTCCTALRPFRPEALRLGAPGPSCLPSIARALELLGRDLGTLCLEALRLGGEDALPRCDRLIRLTRLTLTLQFDAEPAELLPPLPPCLEALELGLRALGQTRSRRDEPHGVWDPDAPPSPVHPFGVRAAAARTARRLPASLRHIDLRLAGLNDMFGTVTELLAPTQVTSAAVDVCWHWGRFDPYATGLARLVARLPQTLATFSIRLEPGYFQFARLRQGEPIPEAGQWPPLTELTLGSCDRLGWDMAAGILAALPPSLETLRFGISNNEPPYPRAREHFAWIAARMPAAWPASLRAVVVQDLPDGLDAPSLMPLLQRLPPRLLELSCSMATWQPPTTAQREAVAEALAAARPAARAVWHARTAPAQWPERGYA